MRKVNYSYAPFYRSKTQRNIFELDTKNYSFQFSFLRFEKPRDVRLTDAGVTDVIESFKNNKKTLHTGIIPVSNLLFYGNNLNDKNKKDFIILQYDVIKDCIHIFLIENKNPKNKTQFTLNFIEEVKPLMK